MPSHPMPFRFWLLIFLMVVAFMIDVILIVGVGWTNWPVIYWGIVRPDLIAVAVLVASLIVVVGSFFIHNIRWFVRAAVVLPFVPIILVALIVFGARMLPPMFTVRPEHVSSVSLRGHVYHLGMTPASFFDDPGSLNLYECDSIGLWCRLVDAITYSGMSADGIALTSDEGNGALYIVRDGVIERQYARLDSIQAVQPDPP